MKKLILLIIVIISTNVAFSQKTPKITYEKIKEICSDVPLEKRIRVSVSSFKSATPAATSVFGDELAQMLTNALQNVNCYNVLLSQKDLQEITDEIELGQSGNVKKGKAPKAGNMLGAQVIVMGKVTEFNSGEDNVNVIGLKLAAGKAKLGFIISLINPETREVIASKSINVQGSAGGFKGFKIFNTEVIGSNTSNKGNKAVADAMEKGIIDAVEFISSSKDKLPFPVVEDVTSTKSYTSKNCKLLKSNKAPKIIVIIPELNYVKPSGNINASSNSNENSKSSVNAKASLSVINAKASANAQNERSNTTSSDLSYSQNTKPLRYSVGESSAENQVNNILSNTGFQIIDNSLFISDDNEYVNSSKNTKNAIDIAKKANADICIYGKVSVETHKEKNSKSSSAVIEFKAVNVKDGIVLASNSFEGNSIDVSEVTASKKAVINASNEAATFILNKLCE